MYIPQKELRYYQKIAIDKVIEAIVGGKIKFPFGKIKLP